ncbi:hypothetical protein IFR05_012933 [Cadophora sp. M221]|nr:hypothetical protein IFR05_012933 [Cadophora sp. M221]
MDGITYIQNRYTKYSTKGSEEFNTASRSARSGLIAAGIVSAWTWVATLLQSSTVAYYYGIADAAGATVQIFMFVILACKVKQNAPRCHTFLEIIHRRYGRATHIVFIFFALLTNILVASQLLLGGSAAVTALTGMNVYAAIFLIPLGAIIHIQFIVLIIILYFMFSVYISNALIGSPTAMFELLAEASKARPVAGNQDGSYITLKSNIGLEFGVIQLCSGMGTVFLDQGYWQRAIASRPTIAVRAYIMGGIAWFAIPFGFATTLGLAAVALTNNPAYPTYPGDVTASRVSSGLSAPFATVRSARKPWCCRSPPHTLHGGHFVKVSHIMICVFGVVMAGFACIWSAIGIDLGWLFLTMGLLIGGAVFPAALTVCWKKQSRNGALFGALGGLSAGLTAWLLTAKALYGELTIITTESSYPTLAGNLASVLTELILTLVISFIKPDDFDWEVIRSINAPTVEGITPTETSSGEQSPPNGVLDTEKNISSPEKTTPKTIRRVQNIASRIQLRKRRRETPSRTKHHGRSNPSTRRLQIRGHLVSNPHASHGLHYSDPPYS